MLVRWSMLMPMACIALCGGASAKAALPGQIEVVLIGRSAPSMILAARPDGGSPFPLRFSTAAQRQLIGAAVPGDLLALDVDSIDAPTAVTHVDHVWRPIGTGPRLLAFGIALAVLLLAATIAAGRRPQRFLIGVDNRYSNSQTQLALWFGVVAIGYGAALLLRAHYLGMEFLGGVDVPANVIALTGLSALSFGGAKVLGAGKTKAPLAASQPRFLTNLVSNGNDRPDLGDFQMILIALVAAAIFAISTFIRLGKLELASVISLPDVDTTLLASFGLGQGAYLIKKAALPEGQG